MVNTSFLKRQSIVRKIKINETNTVRGAGRLCNHIIRNLAIHFLAKKNDLYVTYSYFDLMKEMGFDLYVGKNTYKSTTQLNDSNYMSFYNKTNIQTNIDADHSFFQTQEITDLLYLYLRSEEIRSNIIEKNPYKYRYQNNNDLFIHIRLGDISNQNPGTKYYFECIEKHCFENIYIATDSPNHPIVQNIKQKYSNCILLLYNEKDTIQFGSTCKYIVLSHGTFSGVIGYISFFADIIYYPNATYNKGWCPMSIFKNKGWIEV